MPSRKEYAVTYVTKEIDPKNIDRVWVTQITPQGTTVWLKRRRILVKSAKDCKCSSVTYDHKSGEYAVAYFNDSIPSIGFFGASGWAQEHILTTSNVQNATKRYPP